MSETTTIRTYLDSNGLPVARLTAQRDIWRSDYAGTYCTTNATVRIVSEPRLAHINHAYYEDTQEGPHHGPLSAAWDRIVEDGDHSTYLDVDSHEEAVEVFTRYARIFHPMTPVTRRTLQTGYSQGDWVDVIGWIEPNASEPSPGEQPYQTATREHANIEGHFDIMEAVARGQFWTVSIAYAEPTFTPDETDPDTGTYTLEWHGADDISTLAMEEFDPWEELRECAEWHFNTPDHHTTDDTTHEH